MDKIDLKNVELFRGIDPQKLQLDLVGTRYRILKFKKDELVALRGDRIEGIYINLKGEVVTEMLKDNGSSKKIEVLKSGTILAGAFIFGDYNYFPVDIIAKTDVEILYIEKSRFLKLLLKEETVLERFLDEISEKAQFLSINLWKSISNKRIDQKLAEYFLSHEENGEVKLKLSIKELSEFFNVSRPSLSRVLKEFVDSGKIVKVEKGNYRIVDREYLEELC